MPVCTSLLWEKINLAEKLSLFGDYFSPKVVGELNAKLVKFTGEFLLAGRQACGITMITRMNCYTW